MLHAWILKNAYIRNWLITDNSKEWESWDFHSSGNTVTFNSRKSRPVFI